MLQTVKKRRMGAIVGVLVALAAVTAAVAYFTGQSNSTTGSASVGTSTQWGISTGTPTWSGSLTALYPGASNDTELLPFTVTNNGNGNQNLSNISASIPTSSNGDAKDAGGNAIAGCKAAWFSVTVDSGNPSLPSDLATGGTYLGKVDMTMQDSGTNQDACKTASPAVTITAS